MIEVITGPATTQVENATVEVSLPDEDTTVVVVFEGEVRVKAEGGEKLVKAGRAQTFYRGGEPTDVTAAEQAWRDMLGSGRTEPKPDE